MDMEDGRVMEGWLYLIRSNKIGFQYSRKRYYVLQNHHLKSFKSIPHSHNKDPIRCAAINSCIRVMDNGRKSVRGKVFFIFTLCNTSSCGDHVKLGASSPEEAAKWIKSFQDISQKANQHAEHTMDSVKHEHQYSRSNYSGRVHDNNTVDSTTDPKTAHIFEPLNWTIFSCHNGLRLFKETSAREGHKKQRNCHPAIAAVSVVDGAPEVIFQTLMSLGSSRSEWDFCFQKGSVIENIDGHTDIIHKLLKDDWLPWGLKRRDLLLQRYWRREDDGTYIILYHSVLHGKCPPQKGYVRAFLKTGGYVISPGNQNNRTVVRHMLDIDWKCWRSYTQTSYAQSITIHMLGRLAALREFFKTNLADYLASEFSFQELKRESLLHQTEISMSFGAESKEETGETEDKEAEVVTAPQHNSSLVEMDDESDEFFDILEPLADDLSENSCADFGPEICSRDTCHVKVSPAAVSAKILQEYTASKSIYAGGQRKGYEEEIMWDDNVSCKYRITLPKDQTGNLPTSWSVPPASLFQIRGKTFLEDRKKITVKSMLMQCAAVDFLRSDKREDDLASRTGSIVEKFAANGRPEFFFVVNFQIPGSTTYNLAFYYMIRTPIKDVPLLERFVEGDDAFRNSRFKLIPHVTTGPWILRQSVGRASLIGHILKLNYIRGKNYLEIDVDVGSSTLARGVASTAFSCFNNLVVETAFVIQGNTREELPEQLYGACRLNRLDISKAFWANP